MYSPGNNKISGAKRIKSEELFIEAVANFNQSFYRDEHITQINHKILDKYLILPGTISVALFYLDHETFEFRLGHTIDATEKEQQDIFDYLIENGTIGKALDKGHLVFSIYGQNSHIIIIPVVSPAGIMGVIQVLGSIGLKNFSDNIQNYIILHANQFAFLLTNVKLNNEINNLEADLEQKISLRVEKIKQAQRELQLILNSILTGVFIIEKSTGTIIDTNDAAAKLLKTDKDSIIGTKRNEWEYFENLINNRKDSNSSNTPVETYLLNAEKVPFPVQKTMSNLYIGNKEIFLESFIDISERKKYIDDLKKQSELLKGVDKATNTLLVESSFDSAITKAIEYIGISTNVDRIYFFTKIY
ncbi:MAG: PAS domain-containing protein [Bacteroidetes bacterium]|nr:PAS domain-containing protein [Bacteroidota bacterium]